MSEDIYKDKYIKLLEDHSSMEKQFLKMEIEIELLKRQVNDDRVIIEDLRKNQKLKPGKKASVKVGVPKSKTKSKSASDLKISNSDDIINSIIPNNSNLIESNNSDNLNNSNNNIISSEVVDTQNQVIADPLDLSGEPEATLTSSFSELDINQTPEEIEKEKEILFNQEADDLIKKFENTSDPASEYECIFLMDPVIEEDFLTALNGDRQKYKRGLVVQENVVYTNYWNNFITSLDDVISTINEIVEREKRNKRNIVKFSTTYGRVVETVEPGVNDVAVYTIFSPNDSDDSHHFPVKLNDNTSINKYKEFIKSEIKQINEKSEAYMPSRTHHIAIHKIQVNCFYMSEVGSGREKGSNSIIDKLCKTECAFSYTGKYNICWFAIPVFHEYYSKNPKGKRLHHDKLESETVRRWLEFYSNRRYENFFLIIKVLIRRRRLSHLLSSSNSQVFKSSLTTHPLEVIRMNTFINVRYIKNLVKIILVILFELLLFKWSPPNFTLAKRINLLWNT
jgi:hypothetical protein